MTCCEQPGNLEPTPEGWNRCRECGRRHFVVKAEPGHIGATMHTDPPRHPLADEPTITVAGLAFYRIGG